MALLEALSLVKTYPETDRPAVDHLDLSIEEGEFVAILGRSGSGKSTLLHLLSSLLRPDSGKILYRGRDICALPETERTALRRGDFAVVFQQHHLLPYLSALENVLLPFMNGIAPVRPPEIEAAKNMLRRVGLEEKEKARPGKLSGGEQQRVAIARALARGASVLFADEPTGSLDSETGASIMRLLRDLHAGGVTVAMVTHNPEFAGWAERLITMSDGRILKNAA
jgi:putative ABC transport system ATP-binding protein